MVQNKNYRTTQKHSTAERMQQKQEFPFLSQDAQFCRKGDAVLYKSTLYQTCVV
jgi:hypothetical protein